MVTRRIRFETPEDITAFVDAAKVSNDEIDVKYNHLLVDAKSMDHMMDIGTDKYILVTYHPGLKIFDDLMNRLEDTLAFKTYYSNGNPFS